jgi:hypothetical protein
MDSVECLDCPVSPAAFSITILGIQPPKAKKSI